MLAGRARRRRLVGLVPLVAAVVAGDAALVALLVLAPLAPVAAVALAYRDWSDPAGEISLATPSAGLRLVAMRALLVVAGGAPAGVRRPARRRPLGRDVPMRSAPPGVLPGLALAALVLLAGTTRVDPVQVAVGLSLGWAVAVVGRVTVRPQPAPRGSSST